jgi:hypothetical protein
LKGFKMKMKVDFKSAVCGLLLGAAAVLAMGAGESSSPVGRFQVASSSANNTLVLVDTVTGEVWAHAPGGVSITGSPPGFFNKKVRE